MSRVAVVLLVLLAGAVPALAAESEHHGPSTGELLWHTGNLLVLLGVVIYAARRPMKSFFAERRERIHSQLEEAAELLKQAETRYSDWQRKLVELDTELEKIRGQARQRANEERDRILKDAQAGAERIKQDARVAIDRELRRAQRELRDEAADLAVELATNLISQQIADEDRSRLVDEFISKIESHPASASPGSGGSR